jgi:hypothetical protein
MSSPESGAARQYPRRGRSAWVIVGRIVVVVVVLGVLGFLWLVLSIRSAFPPLPSLYRPQGLVAGSIRVDPSTGPQTVAVRLSVSPHAVAAAAAGDGLVHLQLDVAGVGDVPIETEVGVRWRDPAGDVRPLAPLDTGEDVRWTLACPVDSICDRLVDLTVGSAPGQSGLLAVEWRLVAVVRPPRGTDVADDASVTLLLAGPAQ